MPNPLRGDPTRTTVLRRQFQADLVRRFRSLAADIEVLVAEEDAFGLETAVLGLPLAGNGLSANTRWAFSSNPAKLASFKRWLEEKIQAGILSVDAAKYIKSGYQQGVLRAFTDSKARELLDEPIDFLISAKQRFSNAMLAEIETVNKLQLLYTRAFDELEGVTRQMSGQMSRILSDGLLAGKSPRQISKDLVDQLGINRKRALLIARTEIIHAHAEGQLDAFQRLGIRLVGVEVEWRTAGDDRVCPICQEGALAGPYTVEEAHGLIPAHPDCRCAFVPVLVPTTRRRRTRRLTG